MFRTEYFLNLHKVKEDIEMKFSEALKLMKQGAKVKLPGWNGYWCWDDEKQTIIGWWFESIPRHCPGYRLRKTDGTCLCSSLQIIL